MAAVPLQPVDSVTVTVLIDNVVDVFLPSEGPAKRPPIALAARQVQAPLMAGGKVKDALRAEHGFSALVSVEKAGRKHKVLFDAGLTPSGLAENMARLDLPLQDIEAIVISHGYLDHTSGLHGLVDAVGLRKMPVVIHPDFWSQRRLATPGGDPIEIPSVSKRALHYV